MVYPSATPDAAFLATDAPAVSSIDWGAILGGAVFAAAMAFVLHTFGAAIGLSMVSPRPGEGASLMSVSITAAVWFAAVSIYSIGVGGYLAARLRRRGHDAMVSEDQMRDGAHGLMVWAIALLIGAMLAGSGLSALAGATGAVVGKGAEVAAQAGQSDYFANLALRNGVTGQPIDPETRGEVAAVLQRSAATGDVVERDRAYLAQLVARQTGQDPAAARAQVDQTIAEIDTARQQALAAADTARRAAILAGVLIAATLLISAVAAYFAAQMGGGHRDAGTGLARRT